MTISHRTLPVLAAVVVGGGCADLALEPDQIPHSLVISPADARIKVGDVGKLTVTVFDEEGQVIPGPPSWAPPDWQVSDPARIDFATDGSFTALGNGDVRIGAGLAGLRDRTGVLISPSRVVLSAAAVYVNQVVQNLEGSVPLIAGRDALLRVFVTGDQVSYYEPRAYADLIQDGSVVHTAAMGPPHLIPDAVSERWLIESFNAVIPGDVIQPGVKLSVELDPDGVVPLGPGSQLRVPAEGALGLNVTVLPAHRQTIVPVLAATDTDEQILNWTRGMTAASPHLGFARTVLPIGELEFTLHDPVHTTADLATNTGWLQLIREMAVIWAMEGRSGYYYGAVVPPRNSASGGLGYIGFPVSVGANRDNTFAHELGHNLSLRHAPCGGAGGPDPAFPYNGGSIGVWGYNPQTGGVVDPVVYKDLMGYCSPDWISDYSFVKAMNYRINTEISGSPAAGADRGRLEKTLLLWGSAGNGELLLEPAFLVETPAVQPTGGGPYRLEGFGTGSRVHFSFDFTPTPLEFGGGHFLFAVPFDRDRDGTLERVVLSGPEGEFTLGPASTSPMAIITDRDSGRVRAILRDWSGGFTRLEGNTEIQVSDGLPEGM